eukprot:TRINITY_DN16182_c0_g1_i1.p1 TRINITY_DN16182_c0_g1~~TRINITY_DN16182_c0_g1_i1.p1  ORF type:complete len:337 (+),score=65.80 TRINITY_DN16182_c0_g1_i1:106-1116(+)
MDALAATVVGAAAEAVGVVVDEAANAAGEANKAAVDWDELLAPVPEEMRDKYPGLELLALPGQTQLVLQQKMSFTEMFSSAANVYTGGLSDEVSMPNTYVVKTRDGGIGLYQIYETRRLDGVCTDCFRTSGCGQCIPFTFDVYSARTEQPVARIESGCACSNCCCGLQCCILPVCCCLRSATWYQWNGGEENGPALLSTQESVACTQSSCLSNSRNRLYLPDGTQLPTVLADHFGSIKEEEPENFLGMVWKKSWVEEYQPTTDRYPPLPEPGAMESFMQGFKDGLWAFGLDPEAVMKMFTDADTYLVELPDDGHLEKAGLLMSIIMNDMVYHENNV